MSLSVAVVADPRRTDLVHDLVSRLNNKSRHIDVCWDSDGEGVWANHRKAWYAGTRTTPLSDYHIVLEDDALPCKDLLVSVEKIVAGWPENAGALSLYTGHRSIKNAHEAGNARYIWARTCISGVALVQPTSQIEDWLAWCDRNVTPELINDDYRLSMYLLSQRKQMVYTVPNLVQHQCNTTSLAEKVYAGQVDHLRVASHFIGEEAEAASLDWNNWTRSRSASMGNPKSFNRFYVGSGTWNDVLLQAK